MKKVVAVAVVLAIGLVGTAYAQPFGPGYAGQVDVNKVTQFQKETLPLRDELATRNIELRNEYLKQNPDRDKIAQLQKETIDLRTKIQAAAEKQGLPAWGNGGRMAGRGYGYGPGMRQGGGGYGPRMAGCGYGPGYGRGPAW